MRKGKTKLTRSSGNVFRDLGFAPEDAEHLRVRADLMIKIEKVLKSRGLKQTEAAKLMGVTQPRVSDLLRGRLELFSSDALIDMLARLGVRVRLVTTTSRSREVAQRIRRSAAWYRPPMVAEAPKFNARLYRRSIGTRCATSAAAVC